MPSRPCRPSHHDRLRADDCAWASLDLLGLQELVAEREGEPSEWLELRLCSDCATTMAREVEA
jgi:hypothetical protein